MRSPPRPSGRVDLHSRLRVLATNVQIEVRVFGKLLRDHPDLRDILTQGWQNLERITHALLIEKREWFIQKHELRAVDGGVHQLLRKRQPYGEHDLTLRAARNLVKIEKVVLLAREDTHAQRLVDLQMLVAIGGQQRQSGADQVADLVIETPRDMPAAIFQQVARDVAHFDPAPGVIDLTLQSGHQRAQVRGLETPRLLFGYRLAQTGHASVQRA